jgi:argininosuccinate lyase
MSRGKSEKSWLCHGSVAATLAKFSMDVCLYMRNFDFITLPAHLTTGSSIMPHKKTGCFELIRGKCNKIQALPYEITLITNNLPSGYHRTYNC